MRRETMLPAIKWNEPSYAKPNQDKMVEVEKMEEEEEEDEKKGNTKQSGKVFFLFYTLLCVTWKIV